MTTLMDYYQLRTREEAKWRQHPPAAAVAARDPAVLRRLHRLLRGLVGYRGRHTADFVPEPPNKVDRAAAALCAAYRAGAAAERSFLRSQITPARGWTLLTFSKRAAVRGLQTGAVDCFRDALTAHVLENLAWGDVRDNLVALGLIYHCAQAAHAAPAKRFREAARTAGPAGARVLREFARRRDLAGILGAMGFRRIKTKEGVGFRW